MSKSATKSKHSENAPKTDNRRNTLPSKTSSALIIFARYPKAGKVKTRLAEGIGAVAAADLYAQWLTNILKEAASLEGWSRFVFCADKADIEQMQSAVQPICSGTVLSQQGNNLGERMEEAFHFVFQQGYQKAVIIGTDIPNLRAYHILKAENLLNNSDVVIGPATDGGYYLLGLNSLHKSLFRAIPWSSPETLTATLRAIDAERLRVTLIEELTDIDTAEDLARLCNTDIC